MPKVELNDVILYYSPLTQSIYAGVPDKRAPKGKGYGVALHKHDVSADFWRCLVQRLQDDDGAPVELRQGGKLCHTIMMTSPKARTRDSDQKGREAGPTKEDGTPAERGSRSSVTSPKPPQDHPSTT